MSFKIKRVKKVAKGYRLKPSTHNIISRIQALLNSDLDTAIGRACRKYYRELLIRNSRKI